MSNVISVAQWGNPVVRKDAVVDKFVSCDRFIRSKVVPPPVGSIVFNFKGGKVTVTGDTTAISGGDCEVVIRGNFVAVNGCAEHAFDMFCSIHREIEDIKGTAQPLPTEEDQPRAATA